MSRAAGLVLLALVAAAPPIVCAQPAPPSATADESGTVLHLNERAERMLQRDRLRVELRVEGTDADARRLQDAINRRMAAAVARARAVPGITVQTTGYNVYQERPEKQPPRWHGNEGLLLVGKDFGALLALAGALQEQGLVLSDLAPELSREAAQAVEGDLTEQALTRLRQRAGRIAAALGMRVERFRVLRVGNAAAPPSPIRPMMAMAARQGMAPPVAAAGEATVGVTVDAEILLAPLRP